MKKLAVLSVITSLITLACTSPSEGVSSESSELAGVSPGQLRGVDAISKTISSRLLDRPGSLEYAGVSFVISNTAGSRLASLAPPLMGSFTTSAGATVYSGGTPTPINVQVWYLFTHQLGSAFGEVCMRGENDVRFARYASNSGLDVPFSWALRVSFATTLREVCAFSGDRRLVSGAFFDAVMGLGSSLAAERVAFIERFENDAAEPADRVRDMTIALVMNPYFLLER